MGLNRTRKLLAVMLKWLIIANSLLFNVFECLFSLSDLPGYNTYYRRVSSSFFIIEVLG